jgi:regulator of protease activity HflC (stomatin/prohibitin superfamily)
LDLIKIVRREMSVLNVFDIFFYFVLAIVILFLLGSTIKLNKEWERAVLLRLGRYNRTKGPGLFFKIPIIELIYRRDMRIRTLDIRKQEVITKDNISVKIDAVVFMKVKEAVKSVTAIQDFVYSVQQYSQTTLRNVVGKYELDELLTQREAIAEEVKKIVDKTTEDWGVDISIVELQDIELPEDMKRIIARQAEAEREKRGVIIKSQGELKASENLRKASMTLTKSPLAIELRRLSTLSDVSQDQSNTIVFAVPLESLSGALMAASGLQVPRPKTQKEKNKTE